MNINYTDFTNRVFILLLKVVMDKPSSVSAATAGMVWSDEQVTKLLHCMTELKAKKGVDADSDPTAVHQVFEQEC